MKTLFNKKQNVIKLMIAFITLLTQVVKYMHVSYFIKNLFYDLLTTLLFNFIHSSNLVQNPIYLLEDIKEQKKEIQHVQNKIELKIKKNV